MKKQSIVFQHENFTKKIYKNTVEAEISCAYAADIQTDTMTSI